jgi:protein-S-isoprenylcysteine O-methyltransferase Ste14
MISERLTTSDRRPGIRQRFFDALSIPWVDKTIAVVAVLPFACDLVWIVMRGQMNIPRASVAIQFLVLIITMIIRTSPVRVTHNPWYWMLAFFASYWGLFVAAFAQRGVALLPNVVTDSLSILSLIVAVYARLSLGRSIGLVPAQRVIITRGAYRFVRHPIYTGLLISYFSFALHMYSPRNVVLAVLGIGMFVVKSFIEEGFLRSDPEYAEYLARVRWRWFPGLA